MPEDETISSFADRLIELAEKVILQQGGERILVRGRPVFRIPAEGSANVYPLVDEELERERMREDLREEIEASIVAGPSSESRARGAYLAICLDEAEEIAGTHPVEWRRAVQDLKGVSRVAENLYDEQPDTPAQRALQAKAIAAGFGPPAKPTGP